MESKNGLKEIDIKNCMYYYFHDIINGSKNDFRSIFLDKKLYENISIYNISYKTPTSSKPLCIKFDKIDGKIKLLVLFD